jgi:hypothetical protein
MSTSVNGMTYTFPFGSNDAFPDNGILSQAYDSRVSQNDMLKIGRALMHQEEAYYKELALNGVGIYTWNTDFLALIQKSLNENKMANFSKQQKVLFQKYMILLTDGIVGNEPEDVLALDAYLGGL